MKLFTQATNIANSAPEQPNKQNKKYQMKAER